MQSHSTYFAWKRLSSGVFKTSTAVTLIKRCDDLPATITHVPVATVLVLNTPDDGRLRPKHVEWLCRNKTCTVLHQVGVSFDLSVCLFWRDSPKWARAPSFTRFLDHTQRRTTVGRTPLDEWSACRRDLYLTTHNTLDRHPCPWWDSNPQSQQASGQRPTP